MARLSASQFLRRTSLNEFAGLGPFTNAPLFVKPPTFGSTGRLASYSTFQFVMVMLLESAMTNAGMKILSTMNLPAPVNSTVVPSSMKMDRAMSMPILMFTGQSTIKVNAPCFAAANAFAAPAVSSDFPVQLTHFPIEFPEPVPWGGLSFPSLPSAPAVPQMKNTAPTNSDERIAVFFNDRFLRRNACQRGL